MVGRGPVRFGGAGLARHGLACSGEEGKERYGRQAGFGTAGNGLVSWGRLGTERCVSERYGTLRSGRHGFYKFD